MLTNDRSATDTGLALQQIRTPEQANQWTYHRGLPNFDADCLVSHQVDQHWVVVDRNVVAAHCSLWYRDTPQTRHGRAGLIGHYGSADDRAAAALIEMACRQLARQGCSFAVGPMNQNTWRDYRIVTESDGRPAFFLEPVDSPHWQDDFVRNGFGEIAGYSSVIVDDLNLRLGRLESVRNRMEKERIRIRPIRADRLESDLEQIYAVVCTAFAENPFYVPISRDDFFEMYRPLGKTLSADLALLAFAGDTLVGFCFAVPDLLQSAREEVMDTIVVKTFAALPQPAYGGVGQVLLEEVHQRAAARGFRRAIHALIRDGAPSQRIAQRYGVPFRRYGLFGREISE